MTTNPFENPFDRGFDFPLQEMFSKPKGIGMRRPAAKPDPAPEATTVSAFEPAEETREEFQAPRVILKNPRWESDRVGFNEEASISIEAEDSPSLASKTRVIFELFASTPVGPERICKAEGHIKEGKARARIPVYMPSYKDDAGCLLYKVDYFFSAKHADSDLFRDEAVIMTVDHMAARFIQSFKMEGAVFRTGKSHPIAGNLDAFKTLVDTAKAWTRTYNGGKVALFGHTDATGQDTDNKQLSERRARFVHALLIGGFGEWESLHSTENWGVEGTQVLLKDLGFDPGGVDGIDGPRTRSAVEAFQKEQGLPADGICGTGTRESLFRAYMRACEAPALEARYFEDLDQKPYMGCGESNLFQDIPGECAENRRVTLVLLKSCKAFPNHFPCRQGDIQPCRKQAARKGARRHPGYKCLFYDQMVETENGRGGASGRIVDAFFESEDGTRLEAARPGALIRFVIESEGMTGRLVDIDLSDERLVFFKDGQVLDGDLLENIEITGESMKIPLEIRKNIS